MPKKPKFEVVQSGTFPDWWIVIQIRNRVVVAHCPSEELSRLFVEFLNKLPGKRQPSLKKKPIYPNLKRKSASE